MANITLCRGTCSASTTHAVQSKSTHHVSGLDFPSYFVITLKETNDPNYSAYTYFSETPLAMLVWTSSDIMPGQEITISCTPLRAI